MDSVKGEYRLVTMGLKIKFKERDGLSHNLKLLLGTRISTRSKLNFLIDCRQEGEERAALCAFRGYLVVAAHHSVTCCHQTIAGSSANTLLRYQVSF